MSNDLTNVFQQRRQLAVAVAALGQTRNLGDLDAAARAIYDAYPDDVIQAELLKNLDTPDSQLRGGLGLLAALLPADQISAALRSVAADRSQSAQRRLTAAMLASQYLDQPIPAALLSDLSQGNEVAFQSLLEAVEEGKRNRHVLLEYVMQMREAGNHVPPLIMDLLDRLPASDRVELLRLIALDDRDAVSINALARLDLLASSAGDDDASASALRALHVLQFMLPPDRAGLVEDALRRLRFRGRIFRPPRPAGWRALMSPSDILGNQTIWFVRMPSGSADGSILYFTVNEYGQQFSASIEEDLDTDELPLPAPIGQMTPVAIGGLDAVPFLEAPFDAARWRVLRLIPAQWEEMGALPPDFRLYADDILAYDRPDVSPALQRQFESALEGEDVEPGAGSATNQWTAVVAERTAELLSDPIAADWVRLGPAAILTLPEGLPFVPKAQRNSLVHTLLAQFEQEPYGKELPSAMASGLRTQAAWYELAGYPQTAERLLQLALVMPRVPVSQNPLLAALLEAALNDEE